MKHLMARFLGAALVLGMAAGPASAQNGPNGDWELNLETPQGANTVTLSLKVDGDKATGSLTSPMGAMPMAGTASDGTMALTGNLEIQGMSLQLGLNGKIAGDVFNGTVKMGDFGEFPFTGKRAPAAGAAPPTAAFSATPAPGQTSAAAAAVAGGDITGKWNIILNIAGVGEFPVTADFKQEGANITGTFISAVGEVPVTGTMTGSSLKVEFSAETPQGVLPITLTGELGPNGGFTGKASIAGMGEADWTGVRNQQD